LATSVKSSHVNLSFQVMVVVFALKVLINGFVPFGSKIFASTAPKGRKAVPSLDLCGVIIVI
jgi:hypothetical protein